MFFCFYALVPEGNTFGRKNVAVTLMSMLESYVLALLAFAVDTFIIKFLVDGLWVLLLAIVVVGGTFYATFRYFEKEGQLELIKSRFQKETIIHKLIAVVCFVLMIFIFAKGMAFLSELSRHK